MADLRPDRRVEPACLTWRYNKLIYILRKRHKLTFPLPEVKNCDCQWPSVNARLLASLIMLSTMRFLLSVDGQAFLLRSFAMKIADAFLKFWQSLDERHSGMTLCDGRLLCGHWDGTCCWTRPHEVFWVLPCITDLKAPVITESVHEKMKLLADKTEAEYDACCAKKNSLAVGVCTKGWQECEALRTSTGESETYTSISMLVWQGQEILQCVLEL